MDRELNFFEYLGVFTTLIVSFVLTYFIIYGLYRIGLHFYTLHKIHNNNIIRIRQLENESSDIRRDLSNFEYRIRSMEIKSNKKTNKKNILEKGE